jgi:hypothetical protein
MRQDIQDKKLNNVIPTAELETFSKIHANLKLLFSKGVELCGFPSC